MRTATRRRAACTNALFLFAVTAYIGYESVLRLLGPVDILTREMLLVAATGCKWIDPVLSIGIAGVILAWAWALFRDTVRILMEVAPARVNVDLVQSFTRDTRSRGSPPSMH